MSSLQKKLHGKQHATWVVLNAPQPFLNQLAEEESPPTLIISAERLTDFSLLVAFVQHPEEVDDIATYLARNREEDPVYWFCYPKKRAGLTSSLSRDKGWQSLGDLNLEPVQQVSIDDTWSALRFRRVAY